MSTKIIGFNLSHDSSACILEHGRVTAALALERTTGVKRGVVPAHAYAAAMAGLTSDLLSAAGLTPADIDFWIASSTESRGQDEEDHLLDALGLLADPGRRLTLPHPGHHLAHASAAFYTSGLTDAAALVIDAYGSRIGSQRERESAFAFRDGSPPRLTWRTVRDHDRIGGRIRDGALWIPAGLSGIGEVYRVVTLALGFRERGTTYDDAGKTMGLAAYGRRLSTDSMFIRIENGALSFDGAADALAGLGLAEPAADGMILLPRAPGEPLTQLHRDLAAQVQAEFEEACLHLAGDALTHAGSRNLVLSGGCFLNSVANTRIARESGADSVIAFPAATDDGNAVGAALYAHHVILGQPPARQEPTGGRRLRDVFLGPPRVSGPAADDEIAALAAAWGLPLAGQHGSGAPAAAAGAIARGEIVGWFQDRAEFGPRALGARSILCHPGIPGMKDRLNARVKFRETFRPFAASVLAEHAAKWFDMPVEESPFMLMVCPVLAAQANTIREVVHADGTCRLQTVPAGLPGRFRTLIEKFEEITGLPLVLNTSFNVRGRPIAEDPREALECLYGTRLDRVFISGCEIAAPDLAGLLPRTLAGQPGQRRDEIDAELLRGATGSRPLRDISEALGIGEEDAVDRALRLRRAGLLAWEGVPVLPRPAYPLPQYDPAGGTW
jgi:carbamoyltransferase